MPGMLTPSSSPTAAQRLHRLAGQGWLRLGVPVARGGAGGPLLALRGVIQTLWREAPADALLLRSQRLAIEALLHARNRGLADYLLPQLLDAERAATVPLHLDTPALRGHDTGRGWQLNGRVPWVANCLREGFTLITPVCLGENAHGWAALRGEEDGLDLLPAHWPSPPRPTDPSHPALDAAHDPTPLPHPLGRSAALADVRCRAFFFREDEWLGDADLGAALHSLDALLRPDGARAAPLRHPHLPDLIAACLP